MSKKLSLFFLFLIFLSIILIYVPSCSAVRTDYVYPIGDCKILKYQPTTNYGDVPTGLIGNLTKWQTDYLNIGFFKFNMSDFSPTLQAGEQIQYEGLSFELYSHQHHDWHTADNFFRLCYSTNQTWDEMNITWNDNPNYTQTSEIVEVDGDEQFFSWNLAEVSQDVYDAIVNDVCFTVVIIYYKTTQGFTARFREYGGLSYDPHIQIDYNLVKGVEPIYERGISLANFPYVLGGALGIGEWGGKLLVSLGFILMCILPLTVYVKDSLVPYLIVGVPLLAFLVSIGWLPVWSILILCMILAIMYSTAIKGWFGRKG